MKYPFRCLSCNTEFEFEKRMVDPFPEGILCPECGMKSARIFKIAPVHYNSQGFHNTDYDRNGDKLEQLNKKWMKDTGDAAPPPASTKVPRNSKEPY